MIATMVISVLGLLVGGAAFAAPAGEGVVGEQPAPNDHTSELPYKVKGVGPSSGGKSLSATPKDPITTGLSKAVTLQSTPEDVVTYNYRDVSYDHWAALDIAALAVDGVLAGTDCQAGRFCPGTAIQRWQIAVWLVRVLDGEEPPLRESRFADIDGSPWWESHVERLAELGVTLGCDSQPARFCPTDTVTRAQMAAFLDRAFDFADGGSAGFVDTADVFSADSIDRLYQAGVTTGCAAAPLRFCPDLRLTRAQMAALLQSARHTVVVDAPFSDAVASIAFTEEPPDVRTGAELEVYLCGPPDTFTSDYLDEEVARLTAEVTAFYLRESDNQANIAFSAGGIVIPDEARQASTWAQESISKWADEDFYKGSCYEAVEAAGGSTPFAIIADVSTGGTNGFGYPSSHIVVERRESWSWGFGWLVAHEIGHFLSLCHTFQGSHAKCQDFQESDPRVRSCTRLNRCNGDDDLWHLAASVMSYIQYGAIPNLADSYVACSQKIWLEWTNDCDESQPPVAQPPDAPGRPRLTAGDRRIIVEWTTPDDNGSPITGYNIDIRAGDSGAWTTYGPFTTTRQTITGLTNGVRYEVEIQAVNAAGRSTWSDSAFSTPTGGQRSVVLSVGRQVNIPTCTSAACHFMHVETVNFTSGSYRLECWHNRLGYWDSFVDEELSFPRITDYCIYGYPGHQVYVVVDGVRSDTITWPAP